MIYVGLFNLGDAGPSELAMTWNELGLTGTHKVRDLWARRDLGAFKEKFSPRLPGHGAGLYRVMIR